MALPRPAQGRYDVGHGLARGRAGEEVRNGKRFALDRGEVLLVDEVLGPHLAGPQATRADPAADGFRAPSQPYGRFRNRDHRVAYYTLTPTRSSNVYRPNTYQAEVGYNHPVRTRKGEVPRWDFSRTGQYTD